MSNALPTEPNTTVTPQPPASQPASHAFAATLQTFTTAGGTVASAVSFRITGTPR